MIARTAIEDDAARHVYVDPDFDDDMDPGAVPETDPELQPNRWRFRFPWVKTAVSAPTYNGELRIVNQTDRTWLLWHNYHNLGPVDPGDERHVRLVRAGTVSARLLTDPASEYLLLSLTPDLDGIKIVDSAPGEGLYILQPIGTAASSIDDLPESTSIEDLNLSARTENALKRINVATVGQLRKTDLGVLWNVKNGMTAYIELLEMFSLRGR